MRSPQVAAWRGPVLGALVCVLAFGLGVTLRQAGLAQPVAAYAADTPAGPTIVAEAQTVGNQEYGVVRIDENIVIQLRTWAGDMTPYERGQVVAERLRQAVAGGAGSPQVYWETRDNEAVVRVAELTIATATGAEAQAQGTTPAELAKRWAGNLTSALLPYGCQITRPDVRAERRTANQGEYGVVMIGDTTAIEIWTGSGGYSPYDRARQVADRMMAAFAGGLMPEDVQAKRISGEWAVTAGDTLLITANQEEARRRNLTPQRLAEAWAYALSQALYGQCLQDGTGGGPGQSNERYDKKIVPVLSILDGVRLGAAQVQGPVSGIDRTKAVGQAEMRFRNLLNINVYVPLETESLTNIKRVQGVGVTGLADIRVGG